MIEKIDVSVVMITYGHEKFIREAIEGVLMQDTQFNFELLVVNDASPDKTDNIVNSLKATHPKGNKIRYFKHEVNKGAISNFIWALNATKGEHIAFCDGDDYWTNKHKIDKQITFLNNNPQYSLTCSNYNTLFENGEILIDTLHIFSEREITFEDIILRRYVSTLTTMFRRECLNEILPILEEIKQNNWGIGDLPIWATIAYNSKVKYLNFNSGIYRVLSTSASGRDSYEKQLIFNDSIINISKILINKFNYGSELYQRMIEFRLEFYFNKIINYKQWNELDNYFKRLKLENVDLRFYLKMRIKALNILTRRYLKSFLK